MSDIIAGRNPVLEALNAGRPINKVIIDRNAHHNIVEEIIKKARTARIPVDFVDKHALDRLAPDTGHQGIIAYASSKDYIDLDSLAAISREKNEAPFYLVLDGIEDPQNLGAILRTAEAAGVHGVIVRSHRAVGLTPSVAKASAGAIEYIPVARVTNISQAVELLKKQGVWVVGIDMTGKTNYTGVDFKLPTAIVIGGEGGGLSDLVRKRCDVVASIPMKGKIGSLNASVAAAVIVFEALKQREPAKP
jgi:23S rRNA (guanosine2251-2'-O)-methyltransferase